MKHNYVFIKPHGETPHTYMEGEGMLASFLSATRYRYLEAHHSGRTAT